VFKLIVVSYVLLFFLFPTFPRLSVSDGFLFVREFVHRVKKVSGLFSVHRPIAQNLAEIRFSRAFAFTTIAEIIDFSLDAVAVVAQHSTNASCAVVVIQTSDDADEVDFTDGTAIPLKVSSEFSAGRDFTLFQPDLLWLWGVFGNHVRPCYDLFHQYVSGFVHQSIA